MALLPALSARTANTGKAIHVMGTEQLRQILPIPPLRASALPLHGAKRSVVGGEYSAPLLLI